jgi:hypothetical protein
MIMLVVAICFGLDAIGSRPELWCHCNEEKDETITLLMSIPGHFRGFADYTCD